MGLEQTLNNITFDPYYLGQTVLRYQVPLDVFSIINHVYETKYPTLPAANKQLIGKIEKEHSLFYQGTDTSKMHHHNMLPKNIIDWFDQAMDHYLNYNQIKGYKKSLNSIWVNQMFQHEYNPVHVHQGSLYTGLSSVMILKLPTSFGVEYSSKHSPTNGKLQILGSTSGQFAACDYSPHIAERDFYIFPYDVRHCVYPFNGPGYRRTLSANMDVEYNPIINREKNNVRK
jgi:hypothetical protein|tara:strand:- start:358 stop:1044 length:687 start_codon:yes stop_codon:yes gene_type:complete